VQGDVATGQCSMQGTARGATRLRRAQPFVYVGAAIGLIGYGLFFALTASNSVYTSDLRLALLKNTYTLGVLGLGCGAVSGLAFWHVAIKSRE